MVYNAILVGGLNPSEKYEFVNGKDDIPYLMENEKRLTVFVCWIMVYNAILRLKNLRS